MNIRLPLATVALALFPLAAPLLASSHPLAAMLVRGFFSSLCHQNPARSFVIDGSPVAVCVRCSGIYCGVAVAALLQLRNVPGRLWLAGALVLNLLNVAGETLHWCGNLPLLRFLLGMLLGLGVGFVLLTRRCPGQTSSGD